MAFQGVRTHALYGYITCNKALLVITHVNEVVCYSDNDYDNAYEKE